MLTAVTGINWGDEGKGRVIDLLAEKADIVVRYQGGNNAGHTVVTGQGKFILNLLPSGILHSKVICILGDGMVVDPEHLSKEIAQIREKGVLVTPDNLRLSSRATISMPWHRAQDELEAGTVYRTALRRTALPKREKRSALPAAALPTPTATNTGKRQSVWVTCSTSMNLAYRRALK